MAIRASFLAHGQAFVERLLSVLADLLNVMPAITVSDLTVLCGDCLSLQSAQVAVFVCNQFCFCHIHI